MVKDGKPKEETFTSLRRYNGKEGLGSRLKKQDTRIKKYVISEIERRIWEVMFRRMGTMKIPGVLGMNRKGQK